MADLTFNTTAGQTIAREMLCLYLNTGTATSPTWSPVGKRVEDSSPEYDWGEEAGGEGPLHIPVRTERTEGAVQYEKPALPDLNVRGRICNVRRPPHLTESQ